MRLITSSAELITKPVTEMVMQKIERAGRTCYASEYRMAPGSADRFIRALIKNEHESVLEHEQLTFQIVCDRAVSHELVRHRLASYSQESQRYIKYDCIEFVTPSNYDYWTSEQKRAFTLQLVTAENSYKHLISCGLTAQEARTVLPNCTKTRLTMSANLREWRHFLKLRCDTAAHPDMRKLALSMLDQLYEVLPVVFEDIYNEYRKEQE